MLDSEIAEKAWWKAYDNRFNKWMNFKLKTCNLNNLLLQIISNVTNVSITEKVLFIVRVWFFKLIF